METTTYPTHWTATPPSSDTVRTIERDTWDTVEDGQNVPAGMWKMFEDFVFVGCARDENVAKVWRDAQPEGDDTEVGYNGFEGWGQQSEYV